VKADRRATGMGLPLALVVTLTLLVAALLPSLTPAVHAADAPPSGPAAGIGHRTLDPVAAKEDPFPGTLLPPPPSNLTVTPGVASATVGWNGSGTNASAYRVVWGVEGAPTSNATVNATVESLNLAPLLAYIPYDISVASVNASGIGNASRTVVVQLSPWTLVQGAVTPANASVSLDDIAVATTAGAFDVNTSYLPHVITASHTDYASAALTFDPVWNGTVWANLSLSLLPGTIEGYLAPAIANLSWNAGLVVVNSAGFFQFSVAPGAVGTLSASYPGLVTQNISVAVPANRTVWVNITLAPPNGTLALSVTPHDALAWLDGVAVPLDTLGNASLSRGPGLYALEVTRVGYYPNFQNVTVRSGAVTPVVVYLQPVANATNHNATGGSGGFSLGDPLTVGLIIGVVVAGVVVAALALRERRRPPEGVSPPRSGYPDVLEAEVVGSQGRSP
jgi:hypothetical protein